MLLIACTNLASMLLARAADRRKETAMRLALGAARGRLIRQLLTESMVVALIGGASGALLARWITSALAGWRPPVDIPILVNVTADYRVFLFAFLVSLFTTLLFGLLSPSEAPPPATVVITPLETLRIRPLSVSAIYRLPAESTATPAGLLNARAPLARPSGHSYQTSHG